MSGRRRLHELLPSDVLLRELALELQVEGFRMEDYSSPPGTFPGAQFTTHMVGVGGQSRDPVLCSGVTVVLPRLDQLLQALYSPSPRGRSALFAGTVSSGC